MGRLEDVVMGNLSVSGRPRPLVAVLVQSIDTLNETIKSRNQQVAALRASDAPLNQKVAYVFGFPCNGVIDETFGHTVFGLYKQTDDCIYFGKLLCSDLAEHGERMREEFKRRFGGDVPRIQKVLWEARRKEGTTSSEGRLLDMAYGVLAARSSELWPESCKVLVLGEEDVPEVADGKEPGACASVAHPEKSH
jgi:hypothetical protein